MASVNTEILDAITGRALDLALSDGELSVLEMGCVNAAGLYACDIQKVVMAFEDMKFNLTSER